MAGKGKVVGTLYTLEEVLAAVEEGETKVGVAKMLGVNWQTVDNYCKKWKSVDDAFKAKRKELVCLAERGLRRALEKEEAWAISMTLKTLGKDDGYTERQEVTGKDGEALVTKFTLVLNNDDSDSD